MTSIFQFVKEGNKDEVQKLLRENTKEVLLLKDSYWQTPLHIASFEGFIDIVTLLIKKGSKIDQKDKNGWTPLHCAASAGHFKVCEILLLKDITLASIAANDGTTAFHYLVRKWDSNISPKILSSIVKNEPNIINITAHNLETPLHHACLKSCEESIKFLLENKADTNKRSRNGETCLSFAIRAGYKSVIKLLLENNSSDEESFKLAYQLATELEMHDIQSMIEEHQQYQRIRPNATKPYKKGYLNKFHGKLKGWKKVWVTLDGLFYRVYLSETDPTPLREIPLKDIESLSYEDQPNYPNCIVITLKENPQKFLFSADDKISMAKWILAIDGLKYKYFNSCINQFAKKVLLHNVYKENYKGGFIKSSFDEEWMYSSDGILQCTEAAWNTENGGASSVTYLWDGQQLVPQNGSFSLGWGKFNGFLFEWRLGDVGHEKATKFKEYYWEEFEKEYLTDEDSLAWKWTRHFLTLKTGTGEWIVEGEVPEPVVFFLSLLRYSRLDALKNNSNNSNSATAGAGAGSSTSNINDSTCNSNHPPKPTIEHTSSSVSS
eukprot:gene6120-7626_t